MINSLVQAILLGGYYALIACGLAFMFQVMRIINLAHGSLAILSAYMVWMITDALALSPFTSLLLVLPIMALIGWLLQRVILERATKGGELLPVLSTFGLSIVIDNLLFQHFGANTRSLASYVGDLSWESYQFFGLWIGKLPVIILGSAIVVIGGLDLVLRFTALGRQIRATAFDPDTAGLVGIDARKMAAVAAAIAMMTVAISGTALGLRGTFDAYAGAPQLLFAFEATIIGGVGSLWGVLLGGIILAIAQSIGALIHPQGFLLGGHFVFLLFLFARIYLNRDFFTLRHWFGKRVKGNPYEH
ncbi:branched-chain amino acid ABC transporter permease [Marinomonas posidonica]|uniref:ABC-type transporter, integral membrane subunit n=1 Tax=Marinomonas posidonica (strain CECT 7376 / NCIMB 14433 / IVIA-Po-181) TaxID=491952 RepID=F6CVG8_MARPP|nr:branched-chain amino acid ABC transporter permease [Marinomonas posidonica]AEF55345.1 ABC-type transporter, integral membrane subunit [Marinomonas posidonica IVIA-Po-181]